jgi:hypothetical protein
VTWLDVVLLLSAVGYGVTGYWKGFVVGASAVVGLLAGGAVGALAAPRLLEGYPSSLGLSLIAVVIVMLLALVGQGVGAYAGGSVRRRLTWRPARWLDALAGGALSVVAVLVIAWVLGYAVSGAGIPSVSAAVRSSSVLGHVDQAMPDSADSLLGTLTSVVDRGVFPATSTRSPMSASRRCPSPTRESPERPASARRPTVWSRCSGMRRSVAPACRAPASSTPRNG